MLLGRVSGRPGDRSLQYSSLLEVLSEVGMIQTFYDRRFASGWTFASSTLPNFANGTSGYLWTSERCFGQIPCRLIMSYIAGMSHTWAFRCLSSGVFPRTNAHSEGKEVVRLYMWYLDLWVSCEPWHLPGPFWWIFDMRHTHCSMFLSVYMDIYTSSASSNKWHAFTPPGFPANGTVAAPFKPLGISVKAKFMEGEQ